jgi:hypothetical protein
MVPVPVTLTAPPPEPPAVEPPAVEPPAVEPPAVEPPAVEPPAVEPPAVEPPAVEPPAVEPPAVEPPAVEPPAVEPPAVEPPAVEPPPVEPPAVEPPAAIAVPPPVAPPPGLPASRAGVGIPQAADSTNEETAMNRRIRKASGTGGRATNPTRRSTCGRIRPAVVDHQTPKNRAYAFGHFRSTFSAHMRSPDGHTHARTSLNGLFRSVRPMGVVKAKPRRSPAPQGSSSLEKTKRFKTEIAPGRHQDQRAR